MPYALIDCNNFFVSCERVFRPDLAKKPVMVLSNNDGCVIARSNEVKALGIRMGQPYYQCKHLVKQHDIKVFSSNFSLYGDMSNRVMQTLHQFTPNVEIYSIDEAFVELHGSGPYNNWGRTIRETILQNQKIPVSVGIASTKTLAKVAAEIAKKSQKAQGVLDLYQSPYVNEALKRTPVGDVWGVGRRIRDKLERQKIKTAYDLSLVDDAYIMKHFSVVLMNTVNELRGIPCLRLEQEPQPKKSIVVSRSFGWPIEEKASLAEAICGYAARAGEKLRHGGVETTGLMVFIRTNKFRKDEPQYNNASIVSLPTPTSDTKQLIKASRMALDSIYKEGYRYHKAGVMALGLSLASQHQQNLFILRENPALMETIDHINSHIGPLSVRFAAEGLEARWKMKQDQRSPRYTTKLEDIRVI